MKKEQIQFSLNINDNEISNLDNLVMEPEIKSTIS